jgi:oligoribonuclease (3'-5' exoribonuclease)
MNYLIPLDTETGGLNCETSDILTIYMAMMDDKFVIVDELNLKLKPDGGRLPIAEAQALKANGIDLQKHMADPETITYSEAREKILTFLKKYLKKNGRYSNLRPMGQNIPFDLKYIFKYLIPEEEWAKIVHYVLVDTKPIVDFLKDCAWFPKELGSLSSIVEYLGVPKRTAHNAKEDTLMTIDVYRAILALMATKKNAGAGGSQQQDLISLLETE